MAFMGYNFENASDALPFSVKQNSGVDFEFARSLAVRLKAYVAFGYIEAVEYQPNEYSLYNSAAVIDRDGDMIANYRKKHLYYNDKLWAK
jgi:protein N-terminal amidase